MGENMRKVHEALGSLKAMNFTRMTADTASVVVMRELRESKAYREIGYNTWEDFCSAELGKSYKTINEAINNLSVLGEQFFDAAQSIGLTTQEFRQLRKAKLEGAVQVDEAGGMILIGSETVPLTPAAADEITEAIETLLEDKQREINTLKRTIEGKDKLAEKSAEQKKELEREMMQLKESAKPNLSESMKLLKKMNAEIDHMARVLNPEMPMLELSDADAQAEYGALLFKMFQMGRAYFSTANDLYGFHIDTDGWTPPED